MRRHFHLDAHVQVTVAIAVQVFYALALDAESRGRLRAGGDFDGRAVFQRRNFDLRAERRLHKTHRHLADQIIAVAFEYLMLFDEQNNVKIAGRPAAKTGLPIALRTQSRATLDARRYFQFDPRIALVFAVAVACFTGLFQNPPRACNAGRSARC